MIWSYLVKHFFIMFIVFVCWAWIQRTYCYHSLDPACRMVDILMLRILVA